MAVTQLGEERCWRQYTPRSYVFHALYVTESFVHLAMIEIAKITKVRITAGSLHLN